jgi:tetratricopeptide (TPR) repeat protein
MQSRSAQLRAYLLADPANADLVCELADALAAEGRHTEALEVLSTAASGSAAAQGVRFRLARNALVLGDYAGAEHALQALAAESGESLALQHDLAFAQLCQRRITDARHTIEGALERFGPDTELLVLDARVAMMEGDFGRALAQLDQALALDSGHEQALGVRALALFDSSRMDEAAAAATECLARYPHQHEALLVAATQALWKQDLEGAEAHLVRALARHPNSGRALSAKGQLLMLRERLPEAREVFDQAVLAMPDHIGTWHALAWVQLLQGDVEAAALSYQRAYDLDRNFGDSHGGLALVAALRGDRDAAEAAIKRALRLDPNSANAHLAEVVVLEDRGEHEAAEARFASLAKGSVASSMSVQEFLARLRARTGTTRA